MFNHSLSFSVRIALLPLVLFVFCAGSAFADPQGGTVTGTTGSNTIWIGDATGGSSAGEDTCVADVNCDSFNLTVSGNPADYTGKVVEIEIHWTVPASDYDLYIHKGDLSGPVVASSGNGAPGTSEMAAIAPASSGTGLYTVHVVYFSATAADQYHGSATTVATPPARTGTYMNGATLNPPLAFSPNKPLKAPVTNSDGEPSNRTDFTGNAYIAGIRGFPAGIDLWYYDFRPGSPTYDPKARNPLYRFQPDAFSPDKEIELGGDGGGDVDLAVGFKNQANGGPPFLAFSSLIAANLSVGNSLDRAQTYTLNPLGSSVPADDRQWHGAYGASSVYLFYRTDAPAVSVIQRSNDSGLTYPFSTTAGLHGQTGGIDVNQKTGTVYASFEDGANAVVAVGEDPSPANPATSTGPIVYTTHTAATDSNNVGHLFCTVKVAEGTTASPDGIVYLAYSNDHDVFLVHSTDKGVNWSTPVRVSNIPGGTSIFPWIEVGSGSTRNSVGIAWYGTTDSTNEDAANWKTYYAFTSNATAAKPTFAQVAASDHFIHASNISEGGLTGTANRNLLDYFQVSFDPAGAAVLGYTDDHNDFNGNCYGTRQISGPSLNGGNVPAATEGNLARQSNPDVQPPQQPAPDGAQVTDFVNDVGDALLFRLPPTGRDTGYGTFDIREIKYSSGHNSSIGDYIEVVMKTGDIDPAIAATWRMNFTVNAPFSTLSASKDLTSGQSDYTYGLSDRGDQFFVRGDSTAPMQPGGVVPPKTYKYGTAVRNSDGSITYNTVGDADFGQVRAGSTNTITIRISYAKLNAILAASGHPLIGHGTTLVGLRGSAFRKSGLVREDDTYGGTQYTIP